MVLVMTLLLCTGHDHTMTCFSTDDPLICMYFSCFLTHLYMHNSYKDGFGENRGTIEDPYAEVA